MFFFPIFLAPGIIHQRSSEISLRQGRHTPLLPPVIRQLWSCHNCHHQHTASLLILRLEYVDKPFTNRAVFQPLWHKALSDETSEFAAIVNFIIFENHIPSYFFYTTRLDSVAQTATPCSSLFNTYQRKVSTLASTILELFAASASRLEKPSTLLTRHFKSFEQIFTEPRIIATIGMMRLSSPTIS
ncbi:hypothetical protein WAI453_001474 [Rhynchosporium graminicola]